MSKEKNSDYNLNDILNEDYENAGYSLESILSEYKSEAFIQGERKTPSHELDDKVNAILRGAGVEPPKEKITDFDTFIKEAANQQNAETKPAAPAPSVKPEPEVRVYKPKAEEAQPPKEPPQPPKETPRVREEARPKAAEPLDYAGDEMDIEADSFFEKFSEPNKYLESEKFNRTFSSRQTEPVDYEPDYPEPEDEEDYTEDRPSFFDRIRGFFARNKSEDEFETEEETEEEPEEWPEPEPEPEPDYDEEMERFSRPVPVLTVRSFAALAVVVIMAIFTFMFENGASLPFGIGKDAMILQGVLLIMQVVVMGLGLDILISGVDDLVHADPGADSLVLISCFFTVADGLIILATKSTGNGLSFALISAASVFFAMRGKRAHLVGYIHALKVTKSSSNPYSVISVTDRDSDPLRSVLKRIRSAGSGYYSKLVSRDASELVYSYATPIFVLASLLFAVISTVARGRSSDFTHTIAIMTATIAAFPAASAFALPFMYASSILRKSGSAVSGWGGACDIYDTDGAVISDEDVFPAGSISLSGVKFFEGFSNQKALTYGASLLIASDTGLSRVFTELLRSQGLMRRPVSAFETYEGGGVGGTIDGERVLCGSGAFMNLMGIRVPDKINTVNSVFTAVNGALAAVFTVNYVPANSVSTSLRSLLNTKVNVMFAVRDFNVTPAVIRQKFKVSMDGVEYLPADTSYKLSRVTKDDAGGISALLCRDGLSPFAEVITKGRLIKVITELNTIISVGGTAIGLLLMFFLCATDTYSSASSGNAFIFMLAVELCVLIMSQFVRKRS